MKNGNNFKERDTAYTAFNYRKWTFAHHLVRPVIFILLQLLTKTTVTGRENIPASGAFIATCNHLHILDAPLGFTVISRPMTALTKTKWRKPPFSWLMAGMGHAIYVSTDTFDRPTFRKCVEVLQAGGVLAIFPEGTRSQTGALGKAHSGLAHLSTRTSTPILPLVMHGQEQAISYWKRFRRVPVHIRIGPLIQPSSPHRHKKQLQNYTDQVMFTLAQMLPTQYRGIYAEPPDEVEEHG